MLSKLTKLLFAITITFTLLTSCNEGNNGVTPPTSDKQQYAYVVNSFGDSSFEDSNPGTISAYKITDTGLTLIESNISTYGYKANPITTAGSYAYVVNSYGENKDGSAPGTGSAYQITDTGLNLIESNISSYGYNPIQITSLYLE